MEPVRLADDIYWVGANIRGGELFEGMWPIPDGVSLNAYVVQGEETVLIDLVRDWEGAPSVLKEQLASLSLSFSDFDHLVMNHIEPDHSGWLSGFLKLNPNVRIHTTQKGADLVGAFFGAKEKVRVVSSGDTLPLGRGMELVFEDIPNVHWPETMATYEKKSGILFSCDAFGSYGCLGDAIFNDQISEEEHSFFARESLRYYANIVASFSSSVERAIDRLTGLDIRIIAPSHGIIWRENPKKVIERYLTLAGYLKGPAEPEITVVWGSMYGHTGEVLKRVIEGIRVERIPVHIHQVPNEDVSWVLASAWKSTGLVFGMPTYEYKMFPPMAAVLDMFERKHVRNKKVFRFGSYGWSGGAQKEFEEMTAKLRWDFIEPVEWQGAAGEAVKTLAYERGRELARLVRETCTRDRASLSGD